MSTSSRLPRVFVSFVPESAQHVESVTKLARRLRDDGIDVLFSGFQERLPGVRWFERARIEADYILSIQSNLQVERYDSDESQRQETICVHVDSGPGWDDWTTEVFWIPSDYDTLVQRIRGAVEVESVAPDPAALEDLAQAIALGDKFQLLALQCINMDTGVLLRALDVVSHRVSSLCGSPPLPIVYNPYLAGVEYGGSIAEEWVAEVLGPLLDLAAPPDGEASVVAVVNGLEYDPKTPPQVEAWRYLLQQMNERRNALARTFRGTLLLAFPTPLIKLLFEAAPDLASIRSASIRLHSSTVPDAKSVPKLDGLYDRHLIREARVRRQAQDAMISPQQRSDARSQVFEINRLRSGGVSFERNSGSQSESQQVFTRTLRAPASKSFSGAEKSGVPSDSASTKQLAGLLTRLLTNADMWDFAQQLSKGAQLELPSRASGHELAHAIILDAQRQGRIDRYFFEFLADAHPRHAGEIWQIAASWGVSAEKRHPLRGKLRGPVARDAVHAALLRLTRPQLEQVVRLVWGRVPWMYGKRKLSARELLRHATALGPDGLSQLQDAVDVVTR